MNVSSITKCVDQPLLISNLQKHMPKVLISAAAVYGVANTMSKPKEERKKQAVRNALILTASVAASIIGNKGIKIGGKTIIKGLMENIKPKDVIVKQTKVVEEFIQNNPIKDDSLIKVLKKSQKGLINPKDVDILTRRMPSVKDAQKVFNTVLGEKPNLSSKEIFGEIGRLSLMGFLPVAGGITGGIAADKINKESSKEKTANKIKEGAYQYLANIFMCNAGAGAGLFGLERLYKMNIVKNITPGKKLAVIVAGIITTGVIGGSYIANYISKKVIDPILNKNMHECEKSKNLYSERKPEIADLAMHTDDIATAGVLSGFKWIEPALPLMYTMSGYKAGIGYRNNHKH